MFKNTTLGGEDSAPGQRVQANPLHKWHSHSFQRMLVANDWPQFILDQQRRICPGGFNLSRHVSYKRWAIEYAMSNTLLKHQLAVACEAFAVHLGARRSPVGLPYPLFLDVPRVSGCTKEADSQSSLNPDTLEVGRQSITVLVKFVEKRGLLSSPGEVIIITPCAAQKKKWIELLAR